MRFDLNEFVVPSFLRVGGRVFQRNVTSLQKARSPHCLLNLGLNGLARPLLEREVFAIVDEV